MRVFRIQKLKYGKDISGKGSNLVSGRWNIKGDLLILYTSENRSLALLEKIESFSTSGQISLPKFILIEMEVPDYEIIYADVSQLPPGWNNELDRTTSQKFGMGWLRSNRSLALSVPSVISMDRNVLINPQHSRFHKIKITNTIEDFPIDKRLTRP